MRVTDPYNMYYMPDGRYAIVVAERKKRLDFRDAHTMALVNQMSVPCRGVDHMDFSASGRFLVASCEFSGQIVKVDVLEQKMLGMLQLPGHSMPQDVRLSPDGSVFFVADMMSNGVYVSTASRCGCSRSSPPAVAPTGCTSAATPSGCMPRTGARAASR